MLLIGTRCQPSFQPAERDVRYALSLRPPCHWSKKWKAALQSASGTKFRILMAAGMSTLLKIILMLSCTLRTAELPFPLTFPSADHRISRPWTFQLWKEPAELPKERIRNTTKSFFILQQCNLEWFLLWSPLFCVCPPTAVAKQTAFQIFTDRPAALRKVWNVFFSKALHKQRVEKFLGSHYFQSVGGKYEKRNLMVFFFMFNEFSSEGGTQNHPLFFSYFSWIQWCAQYTLADEKWHSSSSITVKVVWSTLQQKIYFGHLVLDVGQNVSTRGVKKA